MDILRSERFVVVCEYGSERHKIFQIIFNKDGSVFISFPYFKYKSGIVSLVSHSDDSKELELAPGGKATSHLVKYSHHRDGRAHFSQDGKVLTTIKKQSVPLSGFGGHIFTIQAQGIKSFDTANDISDRGKGTSKRKVINFYFNESFPEAIKLVGMVYSLKDFKKRMIEESSGSIFRGISPDGKKTIGIVVGWPENYLSNNLVLYIYFEGIPKMGDDGDVLTFIGGFDPVSIVEDHTKETTLLSLMYPAGDHEELTKRIGSIDLA